eukprot:gene8998-10554_t
MLLSQVGSGSSAPPSTYIRNQSTGANHWPRQPTPVGHSRSLGFQTVGAATSNPQQQQQANQQPPLFSGGAGSTATTNPNGTPRFNIPPPQSRPNYFVKPSEPICSTSYIITDISNTTFHIYNNDTTNNIDTNIIPISTTRYTAIIPTTTKLYKESYIFTKLLLPTTTVTRTQTTKLNHFPNNQQQQQQQQPQELQHHQPKRQNQEVVFEDEEDFSEFEAQRKMAKAKKQFRVPKQHEEKEIFIPIIPSPKTMSSLIGLSVVEILKWMIKMGEAPTRSDMVMSEDLITLMGQEFMFKPIRIRDKDEEILDNDQVRNWQPRTPVVTIVGHIDHGKTSLMDYLRKTAVVEQEAGRITQHIAAFEVVMPSTGDKITFMDTPGHAAFSTMRVRGVSATDIVILIVAADDGVQEQTIEAIRAIHKANAPFIVAFNKMDKPGVEIAPVIHQLLEQGVALEGHGGTVPFVEISAKTGMGIDTLEEVILMQAAMMELRAPIDGPATGVVIESTFIKNRGVHATILVKHGTVNIGDFFVCGESYGKIKEMRNHKHQAIKTAPPATPIEIFGFKADAPKPGDEMQVVETEAQAKDIIDSRLERKVRNAMLDMTADDSMTPAAMAKRKNSFKKYREDADADEDIDISEEVKNNMSTAIVEKEAEHKMANLYLKADVGGSIEALTVALATLPQDDEITYNIAKTGFGEVTDADLKEVAMLKTPLVYFGPKLRQKTVEAAKKQGTVLIESDIIYHVIDQLKAYLESTLEPVTVYTVTGEAKVVQLFNIDKTNQLEITAAGCKVTNGLLKKGCKVRVKRDNEVIHDGKIEVLKHFKELVKEVNKGQECGISIKNFDEVIEGDIIMAYTRSEEQRQLGQTVQKYR